MILRLMILFEIIQLGLAVNGAFGPWKNVSFCSVTCGTGWVKQERFCDSPKPSNGGKICLGHGRRVVECQKGPCPIVNGGFGPWKNVSSCSVTCGAGWVKQERYCDSPKPSHGGKFCLGHGSRVIECQKGLCPIVDGGFGPWKNVSSCSVTCGTGWVEQERYCDNPKPSNGGKICLGSGERIIECKEVICPIDGGFGPWSEFSRCTASCGGGVKFHTRKCNDPKPAHGGKDCHGRYNETQKCGTDPCPAVDGGFGQWSNYSSCTSSCGGGVKYRTRLCNSPAPSNGGADCKGTFYETNVCGTDLCPVDGGFGPWSNYSICTASCGGGMKYRTRKCDDPAPVNGGADCEGMYNETEVCGTDACPVDGGFGPWSNYTICTASCGGGIKYRTRKCDDPAPVNGGADCEGMYNETEVCGTDACPVDGGFGPWSNYSICTVSCGGGIKHRTRKCDDPTPVNGGADCEGIYNETEVCGKDPCPVDGRFGHWGSFSTCTASCGGGVKYRTRKCDNPTPTNGGADCIGPYNQTEICGTDLCPVDGAFGKWGNYSSCTASCGGGVKYRTRKCNSPMPANGGADCKGPYNQTEICGTSLCPVDGGFGPWSNFTSCDVSCGEGFKFRERECNNPSPSQGGKSCIGPYNQTEVCKMEPCPVDGGFGPWSNFTSCDVSCGEGFKFRERQCNNPSPSLGGKSCAGPYNQTEVCKMEACPVDGGFSNWSNWSECSKTCGGGLKFRERECTNPEPAHGGEYCEGEYFETETCGTKQCTGDSRRRTRRDSRRRDDGYRRRRDDANRRRRDDGNRRRRDDSNSRRNGNGDRRRRDDDDRRRRDNRRRRGDDDDNRRRNNWRRRRNGDDDNDDKK